MEKEIAKYSNCFVCGLDNPIGLKLRFFSDGQITRTQYRPTAVHEGYKGITHGGIIATILDEVMIKAALALDIYCVTAQMELRFRAPVPVGTELLFEGEITERKGRIIITRGLARDRDGVIYAEAIGKYMTVSPEMEARLLESLDP
ncbi:MAG: PaaI family thioesterase [candidate division Zixibacteria bacterium]|nr:PaaI family thioesterase [candidate division Zixibacteria bacterium]